MSLSSFSEASLRNHSSQWLPIPWRGARKRRPTLKLSLLQCQKVQNQTNCMALLGRPSGRNSADFPLRTQKQSEGHPIRHLQLLPFVRDGCRQLCVDAVFRINRQCCQRRQQGLARRFGDKGGLKILRKLVAAGIQLKSK